jgi:hypothetical protein
MIVGIVSFLVTILAVLHLFNGKREYKITIPMEIVFILSGILMIVCFVLTIIAMILNIKTIGI